MDVMCRVEMLGELRVVQGEQTHTRFRTHKAASLLAYLALNLHQAHPRERLLDLLWPDMELSVARLNLNTTLTQLRRQLEPIGVPAGSLLVTDKQQVRLNPAAVSADVADFDRLLRQARQQAEDNRKEDGRKEGSSTESKNKGEKRKKQEETAFLLEQAIALYRGPLLSGWNEEWVTSQQTRCQSNYLDALRGLTKLEEEMGKYNEALTLAQRLIGVDPYDESGWQAQMRLLVRLRKPSAALQAYESLEELFQRELGARPSAGSRQMAEMIRSDPRAALLLKAEAARAATLPASAMPAAPNLEAGSPAAAPSPRDAASPSAVFPTPSALSSAPAAPSLPLQLTRFFGREQEREQLVRLLQTPDTRLVSLLGPGGAGKTRLSLEVASQAAPAFANRVWFVSLADIPDASLIASTLLHALRLPPTAQDDPLACIAAFLGDAPCLLVLDNLEHLLRDTPDAGKHDNPALSSCAGLIRLLLASAPGLVCLATSRTPLRLEGEVTFPLPPLALPRQEARISSLEHLLTNESVALYVDRARAARPDFTLTDQNAPAIAALCRRLEGMPLAIEMVAAWMKTLPPQKMLERLERQLDMLVSRRRDLPPRHQSLRATIEWSYDLLLPNLQPFFTRLGVFRGGWTLDAAEAVCGQEALPSLLALQEHSLIVALKSNAAQPGEEAAVSETDKTDDKNGKNDKNENGAAAEAEKAIEAATRYRMLEPLREYAQEKLAETDVETDARRAHAAYFRSLTDKTWQQMENSDIKGCMERLETEQENLRSALTWLETNDPESGLYVAGRLWRFWEIRGYAQEGRARLLALLERCGDEPPTTSRSQAHHAAGALAAMAGDYPNALSHYEQSRKIALALGDFYYVAMAKQQCALASEEMGDTAAAAVLLEEATALYEQMGRHDMVANNQSNLAVLAMEQGDYSRAYSLLTQALGFQRGAGDLRSIAITLNNLGDVARNQGDYKRARECQAESLQIACDIGAKRGSAYALEAFADIAVCEAQWERAAYLCGAAQNLRDLNGYPLTPSERTDFDALVAQVKSALSEEPFAAHWNTGRAASLEQAVAAALADGQ